jgi:hypothetical protein
MAVYGRGSVDVANRRVPWAPDDEAGAFPDPGCVVFRFDVDVPAGHTRSVLFFTELRGTTDEAVAMAPRFGQLRLSSPLMAGIAPKAARRIVNWNF